MMRIFARGCLRTIAICSAFFIATPLLFAQTRPASQPAPTISASDEAAKISAIIRTGKYGDMADTKRLLDGDKSTALAVLSKVLLDKSLGPGRSYVLSEIARRRRTDFTHVLLKLIDDPSVTGWAVIALGETRDPGVTAALQAKMKTSDDRLKYLLRIALGQVGQPYTAYFLTGLADDDQRDWISAHWCLNALQQIADLRAVPGLVEHLQTAPLGTRIIFDESETARTIALLTGLDNPMNTPFPKINSNSMQQADIEARRREDFIATVKTWLTKHPEATRPPDPPAEPWVAAVHYDYRKIMLKHGMSEDEAEKLLGPPSGGFGSANWYYVYGPDAAGWSLFVTYNGADGKLAEWKCSRWSEKTDTQLAKIHAAGETNLRIFDILPGPPTQSPQWLCLSTEELPKDAPDTAFRITYAEADQLVDWLARHNLLDRDLPHQEPKSPWRELCVNEYATMLDDNTELDFYRYARAVLGPNRWKVP